MACARENSVLYVEGPGDLVASFDSWQRGEHHASETSVTYSSQFFEHCRKHGMTFVAISYGKPARVRRGEGFMVSNLPRAMLRIPKIGYDLSLLWYACRIARLVISSRPRTTFVTAGVVRWWTCRWLGFLGTEVIPVMHNAPWPEGYPPARSGPEWAWWREQPPRTLAVSPAIRRQLVALNPACDARTLEFRPTFVASEFPCEQRTGCEGEPFRMLYVGRLEQNKGALDLVLIAMRLRRLTSRRFEIDVCGDGSAAGELDATIDRLDLRDSITRRGRLPRRELVARYAAADVCIVPTRSTFAEGFAQVVAEAILLGCPVVTSPVVPASELYPHAIRLAQTDDVDSYARLLVDLMHDSEGLAQLRAACAGYRGVILDRGRSFEAALATLEIVDRVGTA